MKTLDQGEEKRKNSGLVSKRMMRDEERGKRREGKRK